MKVLVTTVPFGAMNSLPLEILSGNNCEYYVNPYGRKISYEELKDLIGEFDILIAGTETIDKEILDSALRLKFISRVGIGLDGIDLNECKSRGIGVSYTPEAPAPAVAELTLGLMLSLLRHTHLANSRMHRKEWVRSFGRRIPEVTIGIIGVGRIGGRVIRRLESFGSPRLLVNDLDVRSQVSSLKLDWVSKEVIYKEADVISFHLPLTSETRDLVTTTELRMMKQDALVINTARGGIVNENDLALALQNKDIGGAAIDVFESEPYDGPLCSLENCILTSHMGSMSLDCRSRMEIEATEEAMRFFKGEQVINSVPEYEYVLQKGNHG